MGFTSFLGITALVAGLKVPKSEKFLGFTCTDVISFIDFCMNFTGFIVSGFQVSHGF